MAAAGAEAAAAAAEEEAEEGGKRRLPLPDPESGGDSEDEGDSDSSGDGEDEEKENEAEIQRLEEQVRGAVRGGGPQRDPRGTLPVAVGSLEAPPALAVLFWDPPWVPRVLGRSWGSPVWCGAGGGGVMELFLLREPQRAGETR